MTAVKDLGKDSLGSGNLRMGRNISTSSAYWNGMSANATSHNKEGRGHVGVSFTNCELSGPDQGMTSWRA